MGLSFDECSLRYKLSFRNKERQIWEGFTWYEDQKVLVPFIAGALALSLAACGGEDKAATDKKPQEETKQEDTKQEDTKEPEATKSKKHLQKRCKRS